MKRVVTTNWPAFLAGAGCAGLALSVWVRPPVALVLPALCAAAAGALVARDVRRVALAGIALALVGVWWGALRMEALDRSVLAERLGERAPTRLVVAGPLRRTPFALRAPAQVVRFGGTRLRERVLLELPPERAPPQGAVLELRARPVEPRGPETGFDERGWLARQGIHVVLRGDGARVVGRRGGIGGVADRLHAHMERTLARGTTGERRTVLTGIVLGEDDGIDKPLRDAFRASGLAHLLAVSGQNVAITAIGVVAVARIAGILASLGWIAARPRDRWHAMAVGALVLLAWTPTAVLEPGFQLSFGAVAAIFVVLPRVSGVPDAYPIPRRLWDVTVVAVACGLVTAPIVWLHFGTVALWTVPANVAAEPAMPPLIALSLSAAAIEPLLPDAAAALAWLAGGCAAWITLVARLVSGWPSAQIRSPVALAVLIALAAATVGARRLPRSRRRTAAVGLVSATLAITAAACALRPVPSWRPPEGLRITFFDVGQGDSALLEVPGGAVLVDEGPPEADVAGQLRRMGLRSLTAIVLTHPQRDHIGGAAAVIDRLRVREVADPGIATPSGDHDAAVTEARKHGVPVVVVRQGDVFRIGRLELRVLWPDDPGLPSEDPNRHAVVALAAYGATDVLLTADAESDVLSRLSLRPVEILKVAHHGSEDPGLADLLRELRPRLAVISVGRDNDYGHPRPETIAALTASPGLETLRTDENGRIVVESDGQRIAVRSER